MMKMSNRSVRRAGACAAVAVLALGAAACGAKGAPSAQESPVASSPSPSPFDGDLHSVIVDVPESASRTQTLGAPEDGVLDLEAAAAMWMDPEAGRETLREFTFQQGLALSWEGGSYEFDTVQLMQFGSAGRAALWTTKRIKDFPDKYERELIPVDGGKVIIDNEAFEDLWYGYGYFTKGDIAVELFMVAPNRARVKRDLLLYAELQYERLP